MTISEVIRYAGLIEKGNVMEEELAVLWLSELDGMIQSDIMLHSPEEIVSYSSKEDELLLKPPHDKLYVHYLVMMIRQQQQEFEGYQNAQAVVEEKLKTFRRWYVQHYRPADSLSDNGAVSDPGTWGFAYITAYGLAVQQGYRGTLEEWLESLKGEAGEDARMRYDAERETVQWGIGEQWYDLFTLAQLRDPAVDAIIAQATAAAQAAEGFAQTAEIEAKKAQQSMERAGLDAQSANAAAEVAEDAAEAAAGSAGDAGAHADAAKRSEDNSRLNLHQSEVAAQAAEAAARRAEEAAANAGQGGSGGGGSWDELEGKPVYVQTGPHTVVWEGAMDGERFVATSSTSDATYLKISNEIPSKAELAGAKLTHSSEVFDPGPITDIEDGTGCHGSEDYGILIVTRSGQIEDTFGRDGIAPGTGIYVRLEGYEGQDSPSLRLAYGEYSQEKFDPAWLPDGGVGWEGPGGKTDILPEAELVVDENTQTMPMPDGRTLYGYIFHPMALALVDGEEYQITVNGVVHSRTCVLSDYYDTPMYYLGNLALPGVGEDTGEDWVFFVQEAKDPPGYLVGMFATTNAEYKTVAVSAEGTVVHQILDKFIPASIARTGDIKITWEAIPDKPFGVTVTSLAAPMTLAEMRYTGSYSYGLGFLPQRITAGERYLVSVDGEITEWVAQQIPTGVYLGADPRAFNEPGTLPEGAYSIWQSSNSIMVYLLGDRTQPIIGVARVEIKYIDERVIPDSIARVGQIPSDAHIRGLIDEALGGIENGTY